MDPSLLPGIIGVFIPIVAIVGGIAVAIANVISKGKIRQLEIRERIAMIEKGLIPSPEVDPHGFDRAMNRFERPDMRPAWGHAAGRHRRLGITLMGVGFGLMVLIAFTSGEPRTAIGVGGFIVILGLAFLINSLFEPPHSGPSPTSTQPPGPPSGTS